MFFLCFALAHVVLAQPETDAANRVSISVSVQKSLSINGSTTLRRDAYFNIHGSPRELDRTESAYLIDELGVSFGRSMGGLSSTFAKVGEDPGRPGFLNAQALVQSKTPPQSVQPVSRESAPRFKLIESAHPYTYFRRPQVEADTDRFVPQGKQAIAEAVAAYFKARRAAGIAYFEPTNEANVHLHKLGATWEEICELHRFLAKHLHKETPWLKVGGPSSAYPAFEIKDFELWNRHMGPFIKTTASDLDFLSLHLYTTHWDDSTNYRFGGNIDAILDLIENQSLLDTGEVKPLLISECGTGFRKGEKLFTEYSPARDGRIIAGANHMLMTLLKRDDRLLKMIPFMVLKAKWWNGEGPYPWCLFHEVDGEWQYTHLLKWYQLWQGVQGEHLVTESSSVNVQTHAVLDGDTLFVCLDNLNQQAVPVKLNLGSIDIDTVEFRRLCVDGEVPVFDVKQLSQDQLTKTDADSWQEFELAPEEAVVLKVTLRQSLASETTLVEKTHYGRKTLKPFDSKRRAIDVVSVDPQSLPAESALLRLGIARDRKLQQEPMVKLNGRRLKSPMQTRGVGQTNYKDVFTTREFQVPTEWLRERNRIEVSFPAAASGDASASQGRLTTTVLVTRHATKKESVAKRSVALKQSRTTHETN